jgi:hypothetical protein
VINGLVASYARLDRIETISIEVTGDEAVVDSELIYLTALDEHRVRATDRLSRVDGRWALQPHEVDISIPPDQLVSRPSVGYVSQGRRRVTDETTLYQDVIDRPEIHIRSSRLVEYQGQLSVVGEIRNDDVDPGYVTVSAELLDADGVVLTQYAAATGAVHTALPGEVVPFRIDFEGVAGLVDNGDGNDLALAREIAFEPGGRTPLVLDPGRIAEVRVAAKAVVTALDLDRSLTAQHVVVEPGQDTLTGEIRNDGLAEVTVPHVFLTLRDERGEVGWVHDVFVSDAVRSQRSVPFSMTPPAPDDLQQIEVPIRLFANGQEVASVAEPQSPLTGVAGWPKADLLLVGFAQ